VNENDRAITGLVSLSHALVHTYELSLPILLGAWQLQYGASDFVMGLVLTAGYAPFGLGALPGGVLADAYGSRRLIVGCLLGMGGSFVALAAAPDLAAITVFLLFWGVAASVYHPSGLSLISKGVDRRGSAFAYHGIAGNLGIALGPLATALLLFGLADWRIVVALLGVPALIAAGFAVRVDVDETAAVAEGEPEGVAETDGGTKGDGGGESSGEETAGGDARASGNISSFAEFVADSRRLLVGSFLLVFAAVMLSGLYYRGFLTFLPELLDEFPALAPVEVAGRELAPGRYVYVGLLMVGVVGQFVGGKLTDRIPVELGLAAGYASLAVLALGYLPVATAGLGPLLAVSAVMGVALFVVQPFYQATVAEYTPAGLRGLSYGFTYLGVFGVGALGGAVAGGILTFADERALFLVLAGFAGVAAVIGAFLYRRRW
jgi:MFS family permease